MNVKNYLIIFSCLLLTIGGYSQKQLENLDRGLVAVRTNESEVFLSWRMFITDPTNIGFNLYLDGSKINDTPIISTTNYTHETSTNGNYQIRPIMDGVEQTTTQTISVMNENILRVPLNVPDGGVTEDGVSYSYTANDASVGDLDGDGEYEIILKWEGLGKDNSQSGYTSNVLIDAYKLDGTQLWRIDLGRNIRSGAHYTQFMVYDFDGNGKAEIACKTAPNTSDGTGSFLSMGPAENDDDGADYRNDAGYVLSGPEYLSVFNGETGAEMATVDYIPERGSVSSWGDDYGNRVDRFLAGVGYFDGQRPSLLMARGYYTRSVLVAWDWRNGELTQRWIFDTDDPGNGSYAGQGNHSLSINDVDGDGRDEVIYGSMALDDDGTGLYNTGLGHGDAQHVGDFVPSRPGQESWSAHESPSQYDGNGLWLRDAGTGEKLWGVPATGDVGRALSADIDPNYPGHEMWGAAGGGTYSAKGELISSSRPSNNFAIWWDGDLLREILNDSKLDKWNPETKSTERLFTVYNTGAASNNGTKATPSLTADILGDWREEMIYRNSEADELLILTSTIPTPYKLHTLMHDPQYRVSIAWQNTAYNQPPHTSFFLGAHMNAVVSNGDDPSEILKATASEGSDMNLAIASLSSDLDQEGLTFEKAIGPAWFDISEDGIITGIPKDFETGLNRVSVNVFSDGTISDIRFIEIEVTDTNTPPVWESSPIDTLQALMGFNLEGNIANYASDPDSEITFSKVSGPEWLNVEADGSLSGIPDPSNIGNNTFTLLVEDDEGESSEGELQIDVVEIEFLHHYTLDENTDDIRNEKHGTPYGNPEYATGIIDQSIVFDGSDDYISLPEGIANHQKITIATWVNWDGDSNFQRIFDFGDDSASFMFLTPTGGDGVRFGIRNPELGSQDIYGPTIPEGEWTHIAITIDASVAKLYINGEVVGENTSMVLTPASLGNTSENYLGRSQFSADPPFQGQIDDFRIYNYALNEEEIMSIKNLEDTQLPVLKSDTLATAISNADFKYVTVATNNPTSYTASGLPEGLTIDSDNGLITGRSEVVGDYDVLLNISNDYGATEVPITISTVSNVVTINRAYSDTDKNVLEWEPLQDFQFLIERSESPIGPFTVLETVNVNSFTDDDLGTVDTYYYKITSIYEDVELATSEVIAVSAKVHQIAYYNFDESEGQTIVDLWGSNDGNLMSDAQRAPGQFNNGVTFDGSENSFATLPDGIVSTLSDFTMSTWVHLTSRTQWIRIFDFGSGQDTYMFLSAEGANGEIRYAIKNTDGSEQSIDSGTQLPVDVWTHIAVTQSGDVCKIYINGTETASQEITLSPNVLGTTSQNYLAKSQYPDPLLEGSIDDFKIFDRALSSDEINKEMKASQVIIFEPLADVAIDDDAFSLDVTTSSGLGLTYTSSNDDVATVTSEGMVEIVGLGTTVITASQAGNMTYTPATENQILNVVQTLSLDSVDPNESLSVYPNPTRGEIIILGLFENQEYSIYDTMGSEVQNGNVKDGEKIYLENLSNGIYFLKFKNGKVMKLIKK